MIEYNNAKTLKELRESEKTPKDFIKDAFKVSIKNLGIAILPICIVPDNTYITTVTCCYVSYNQIKNFIRINKDINSNFIHHYIDSLEYKNLYGSYQLVLENIKELLKSMDINNEMEIFSAYNYLYRRGYISLNHEFYYTNDLKEYEKLLGSMVILGKGCCRHINSMLTDLLNLNDKDSYNASMNLDFYIDSLGDDVINKIEKEIPLIINDDKKTLCSVSLTEALMNKIVKLAKINHMATLFVDDSHSYIMDACNNIILPINNKKAYHNENEIELVYHDFFNKYQKNSINKLLKNTDIKKLESLKTDYYKVLNTCKQNTDIFEKFYKEQQELYQDVEDKIKIFTKEYTKYGR